MLQSKRLWLDALLFFAVSVSCSSHAASIEWRKGGSQLLLESSRKILRADNFQRKTHGNGTSTKFWVYLLRKIGCGCSQLRATDNMAAKKCPWFQASSLCCCQVWYESTNYSIQRRITANVLTWYYYHPLCNLRLCAPGNKNQCCTKPCNICTNSQAIR